MYKYVTKGTFDAYNWGLVENKQKFIGQVMTSKSPARSAEDVDATALSYAEPRASPPLLDDVLHTGVDLAVGVVGQERVLQTLIQRQLAPSAIRWSNCIR